MFTSENIKLGIAPINWTNDDMPELGGDIPFTQCIKEMADAGYVGSEVGNKYSRDPAVLSKALQPVGLQISSAWCSTYLTEPNREEETVRLFTESLHFLKAMGAKFINAAECGHCTQGRNLPIALNKPVLNDKQWRAFGNGLNRLGEIARKNDMTLVYHYHMGTCVQTQEEVDRLMSETDPQYVSLLFDTGHLHFAGGDCLKLVKEHGKRIKYVHLKDIRQDVLDKTKKEGLCFLDAVRAGVFTVPGDGCIDFAPLFAELNKLNYSGWFIVEAEQDPQKAHPLTYAKKSRAYIKEKIGV